jgi:flagellar protein FliS
MARRTQGIDLYESVQRDADLLTGSRLKMIQVLFESLSAALSAALGHGAHHALERRQQALSRAMRIIKGLQLTLDSNREPLLGSSLGQLYSYMGARLWHAHVHRDHPAIHEVLSLTRTLSDAWQKLSHSVKPPSDVGQTPAPKLPFTTTYRG